MLMYPDSGQNKLNVNEKEKKLTLIYIKEKNLVSRQNTRACSKNITVFMKNNVRILKSFLTVTGRMIFAFVSRFTKKTYHILVS